MDILQVGKYYPPFRGGMESVVETLSESLAAGGHSVTVLCANDRRHTESGVRNGVRVLRLSRVALIASQPILPSLALHLWREARRADVIHLHSPNPLAEVLCLPWRHKLVVTYHCDVVTQRRLLPLYSIVRERILGGARFVVVASKALRQTSAALDSVRARVRVIAFGVSVAKGKAPARPPYALFIGRLVPYKGLRPLLPALAGFPGRLLIVGEGPQEPLLREEIERLGLREKVELLGPRSDAEVADLLEGCRMLVLPSDTRAEAFGMVLLEAMARGKPLVTFSLDTGVAELNVHEGTGLVAPLGDVNAFVAAMSRLFAQPELAARLGAEGRRVFEEKYTTPAMTAGYLELYRRIGGTGKPKVFVSSHAAVLDVNRALFQELQRRGRFDVAMAVPRRWRGDLIAGLRFEPSANDEGIGIHDLPVLGSGNGSLFVYARGLRKALRRERPDVVFVDEEPWSLNAVQLFLAAGATPAVFYTKQNLKKIIPLPFRLLERWVFGRSRAAFSVEREVEEVLGWKGYRNEVIDFPHSFDPKLFYVRNEEERRSVRREYGLAPESLVVLYCGRLAEEKGIRDLVAALARLDERGAGVDLEILLVGNGPLYTETERACGNLRRLRWRIAPAVPHHQVGRVMAAADILVLPSRTTRSWKEQFGRVVVEAMACGAAVVGSDSGAIARVIARTGGGMSYPEGDVEALAAKLAELATDRGKLTRLRVAGETYVHRELTHAAMAEKLETALLRFRRGEPDI